MYTSYVESYEKKIELMHNLKKRKVCSEVFQNAQNRNVETVESLLIAPIQRIPRYLLLLKELMRCTDSASEKLSHVYQKIEAVCNFVNNSKRNAEGAERMIQLQTAIVSKFENLVIPGRFFIREGECFKIKSSLLFSFTKMRLFLFNDILVFTSPNSLTFKGVFKLDDRSLKISKKELLSGKMKIFGMDITSSGYADTKSTPVSPKPTQKEFLFEKESERNSWVDLIESTQNSMLNRGVITSKTLVSHGSA